MDRTEVRDILISWLGLSVAFMFLIEGIKIPSLQTLSICLFLVAVSFLSHEFGHRQVARRYGFQASYEMWPLGIVLALFSSLLGFLIAAPGAVVIRSGIFVGSRKKFREISLKISIAGIMVNLIFGGVLLFLSGVFHHSILLLGAQINVWLAIFNLLPIPPLDGSKVFYYNKKIWALSFLISIGLFMLL